MKATREGEVGLPLLKTKFYIPPQRPNLVHRQRLIAKLEEALRHQYGLILISAKAGSGKTTLVSEWVQQQDRPVAWLSLDANDNDPRRFFNYLFAVLHRLGMELDQRVLSLLEMDPLPAAEILAADLINEIATSHSPFLLILDDYHLIQNDWIHGAVGFLAEHQPLQARLILLTRVDPPLSLARLRGRGQITEIRGDDLRFTPEEVDQFLNEVMKLHLSAEAVSSLEARTEGWIVGLQMAALSMQGRKQEEDLTVFIDEFSGTNRFILDYLLEEVLSQQSPTIQEFLLDTSILERMCGELCDAVQFNGAQLSDSLTGSIVGYPRGSRSSEATERSNIKHESQSILVQLERSNLFVVSLDNERRWYRYHHLFADLLKSTLKQRKSAEEIRELHRRASRWHQGEGYLEEAMIHAMEAQDFERAASMIDENIVSMLSRSEGPVLLGWIEKLPDHISLGRPWVDIYRAYTLALSGRPDEADPLLEEAERRINPDTPRYSELLGHIAAIRSYTANLWGDVERVLEMAALAEQYLTEEHLIARGMASYSLTVTYFAIDDMESASKASQKMLEVGKKLDRLLMIVTALCDLASVKKVQGQLHQAESYYERAHQWLVKRNGLDSRLRCPYEIGLADLLYQWNRLDQAYKHAVTGIEYCKRFNVPSEQVSGYIILMRILQAQGDAEGALGALRDAEQIRQTHYVRLPTKIELRAARVVQWLALGDTASASRWAEDNDGSSELEQIALAQLRLAQGDATEAQQHLDRQRTLAEEGDRNGRLIKILSLLALVLKVQDQPNEAEAAISLALSLARPEGYKRVFLDLGWPLYEVLKRLGTMAKTHLATSEQLVGRYERELLDAFQQENERQKRLSGQVAPSSPLGIEPPADPLTERELEVLQLLAEGLSNKEIADRLVVAPSTVKQHLKNIYSKLEVHSRLQAVERGRELELL